VIVALPDPDDKPCHIEPAKPGIFVCILCTVAERSIWVGSFDSGSEFGSCPCGAWGSYAIERASNLPAHWPEVAAAKRALLAGTVEHLEPIPDP
jgi:hypothetical protein